jgi:hypothetical protein
MVESVDQITGAGNGQAREKAQESHKEAEVRS